MLEEQSGWCVTNISEAPWFRSELFGQRCKLEGEPGYTDVGINLTVVQPGQPVCRYHRENAQENFLVLAGEALLIVNGERRELRAWDFVHCAPGVSHVFVGAGAGPCAILMIGHRPELHELYYPKSELAAAHGAETPEATAEPRVAYSDAKPWQECPAPEWPIALRGT